MRIISLSFYLSLKSYRITYHAIILPKTLDKTAATKIQKRKGESTNTQHPHDDDIVGTAIRMTGVRATFQAKDLIMLVEGNFSRCYTPRGRIISKLLHETIRAPRATEQREGQGGRQLKRECVTAGIAQGECNQS